MRELGLFPWILAATVVGVWITRPTERRALAARIVVYTLGLAVLLVGATQMLGMWPPPGRVAIVALLQLCVVLPIVLAAQGMTKLLDATMSRWPTLPRRVRSVIAALAGQGLVFVGGLPIIAMSFGVRRANSDSSTPAKELGVPASSVAFVGSGGTPLRGIWLSAPRRRGVVMMVHGLAAEKLGAVEIVRSLVLRGYDVFCFDQRGHGESGGHTTTLGAVEQDDVRAAWQVVLDRTRGEDVSRVALGISLGGAALQLAAPDLAELDGLMLDSTFARADAPARRFLRLPEPFGTAALALARIAAVPLTGYAVLDVAPVDAARRNRGTYDVTIVHGTNDPLVPYDQALALKEAYGARATLVTIASSIHPATFVSPTAYDEALLALARSAEARHATR